MDDREGKGEIDRTAQVVNSQGLCGGGTRVYAVLQTGASHTPLQALDHLRLNIDANHTPRAPHQPR